MSLMYESRYVRNCVVYTRVKLQELKTEFEDFISLYYKNTIIPLTFAVSTEYCDFHILFYGSGVTPQLYML